ncbi:MAG: magnesium-translocating P-type ATPase [Microbacteriaceae bacterium]|nr:magnesium-translocating P-type ATPase [Microbacteriaceae bacterium]
MNNLVLSSISTIQKPNFAATNCRCGDFRITGEFSNSVEIGIIILISVVLSFSTEYRAEKANADLHARVAHSTTVIRDGVNQTINVLELVPGDVVILGVGSIIPADMTLLEVEELECDESLLTGESLAVTKNVGDQLLMGTTVKSGRAKAVVTLTGQNTQFGLIAKELGHRPPESDFQKGLARFSVFLIRIALVTTILILGVNLLFRSDTYNFSSPDNLINLLLFALAISVGMTPQLLPAIVSTALAMGSKKLANQGVLVKRLVSIEDLGDVDILITDKTGTLTKGEINFEKALSFGSEDVFTLGLLATEADYKDALSSTAGLNQLDAALWANAKPITAKRINLIPFDHERRIVSVLLDNQKLIAKGSPEEILNRCVAVPESAHSELEKLFAQGSRVVAVATRELPGVTKISAQDEKDFKLEGFLIFTDPVKEDVHESLEAIAGLGMEVKIATGDAGQVAIAVCKKVGLDVQGFVLGSDLEGLSEEEFNDKVIENSIFARVSPEQKAQIIRALKASGKSVAFLGDGVNDAIALHEADVGISVDTATDVAKDAADVVLLEKDLGVLAKGVSQGRKVFNNTMKYVLMGTAGDFGNLFSAALGTMLLPFLPMTPGQILLQDVMYDASQLSIPGDNVDKEQVARPSHWKIGFIRKYMLVFGLASSVFDFLTFGMMLYIFKANQAEFSTGWFVESLATATLIGLSIRTRRIPFFRSRPSLGMISSISLIVLIGAYLPYSPLATVLGFTPLPPLFFVALCLMVIAYIVFAEIGKRWLFVAEPERQSAREITKEKSFQRRAAKFHTHVRSGK